MVFWRPCVLEGSGGLWWPVDGPAIAGFEETVLAQVAVGADDGGGGVVAVEGAEGLFEAAGANALKIALGFGDLAHAEMGRGAILGDEVPRVHALGVLADATVAALKEHGHWVAGGPGPDLHEGEARRAASGPWPAVFDDRIGIREVIEDTCRVYWDGWGHRDEGSQ